MTVQCSLANLLFSYIIQNNFINFSSIGYTILLRLSSRNKVALGYSALKLGIIV